MGTYKSDPKNDNIKKLNREKKRMVAHRRKLIRSLIVKRFGDLNDPLSAEGVLEALKKVDPIAGDVTPDTIMRDFRAIKKENRELAEKTEGVLVDKNDLLREINNTLNEVEKSAWQLYYSKGTDPKTKSSLLKTISQFKESRLKNMQMLGFLEEAPQKHQYLDKDGNPINPPELQAQINVIDLNSRFIDFLRLEYQTPKPETIETETI